MYRFSPLAETLWRLVAEGEIGAVGRIKASFSFRAGYSPGHRLFSQALGGGGILDVGGYPISISRLIAGAAQGQAFADPEDVRGMGHFLETGVDGYASGLLRFGGDIIAEVSCGVRLSEPSQVQVIGTAGWLRIERPWFGGGQIVIQKGKETRTLEVAMPEPLYSYQARALMEAAGAGKIEAERFCHADSLGNAQALDNWRAAIGLTYESETGSIPTLTRRRLRAPQPNPMQMSRIAGLDKDISRLVLGCPVADSQPRANLLYDAWIEAGGNAFDNAWIYGRGWCERRFGDWLAARGIRAEIVILGKGAHTPRNWPEAVAEQLEDSLQRMQTDYLDIYMLHRDNPEVPAGEWAEAVHRCMEAGKIRAWGVSNWSMDRIDAVNAYAHAHGLHPIQATSNNFSLARMIQPVWPDCVASSEDAYRQWHERTGMPNFAWSSQARGFFTHRSAPDKREDPNLVKSWYSPENFERKERAIELAQAKGCAAINVAGAYVLAQPFPQFALVGPRTLPELRSTLETLRVELTPEETEWLDLRR